MRPFSSSARNKSAMNVLRKLPRRTVEGGLRIRQSVVFPFEEHERPFTPGHGVQHLTDKDRVVTAFVRLDDLAFEIADRAVKNGDAIGTGPPFHAGELVRT